MAQGNVQRGAPFAVIDRLAGTHARDPAGDVGGAPEAMQQRHGFGADALLGIVQQPFIPRDGKMRKALRVGGEHVAQMATANCRRRALQGLSGDSIDSQNTLGRVHRLSSHSHSIMPISKG